MPLFRDHVAVVVDDRVHADLRMTAEPLGDLAPAPPIAPPIWEFPMETRAPILVEDAFESCRQQAVATTGVHAPRTRHNNRRRSEEHTSELQSLMRNSYAVFCLKKT